ncbi:MAG: hypothetical protein ACYC28_13590 [Longimicrobiales bacterium]
MKTSTTAAFVLALATGLACRAESATPEGDAQDEFWSALQALCDSAYAGQVVEAPAGDTTFDGKDLVMHVRHCSDDATHIAFNVSDDRSRTWVLTRTGSGLRLKHDHRHEDGTEDAVTQYGGDTQNVGEATRQEFHADAHTAALIPEAATNVWTVEVLPDRYAYALRREGTDRRFRVEFDTTQPVPAPPASWGHEGE